MAEVDVQSLQGKPPEEASTQEPVGAADTKGTGSPTAPPVTKRIYVCCDGTGNEFAAKDSLDGNSNVVKFYTALNLDRDNVGYYHPGVGTLGDPTKNGLARKWSMIAGLAFGQGFRDNVLDAYRYLMQHYAAGDKVFIFGFSRGAYTARALAGLLHGYGLLCRGNEGHIPYAWRMYTAKVASEKELNAHSIETDTSFRDTFSHRAFSIQFLGLWDTVSSVGWISTPMRLLDMAENSTIQRGRHAISIDERRCFYQDNLWGNAVAVDVPVIWQGKAEAKDFLERQDLLQVWFPGVHSDVGGSYPQLLSGLANETLEWMIGEAREAGAIFDESRVRMVLGEPKKGEPTALTAVLAPLYEKPKSSMLHKSLHTYWWLLEVLPHRYYDKDDSSVTMRIPLGAYRKIPNGAIVHTSVKERLETDPCYRPKNITAEELTPVSIGTKAYFRFDPKVCREYKFRENGLVVFTVKVLELALLVYLLALLVVVVSRTAPWPASFAALAGGGASLQAYALSFRWPAIFGWAAIASVVLVAGAIVLKKLVSWIK